MTELIRILHLNDLHSHFENFPKVKRFFHDNQARPIEMISLDLGDNIDKSHPLTEASSGKANVQKSLQRFRFYGYCWQSKR